MAETIDKVKPIVITDNGILARSIRWSLTARQSSGWRMQGSLLEKYSISQ